MTDFSLQNDVEKYVKDRKILKKDFAEKIGISPAQLSHWLKGRVCFPKNILEKIISEIE